MELRNSGSALGDLVGLIKELLPPHSMLESEKRCNLGKAGQIIFLKKFPASQFGIILNRVASKEPVRCGVKKKSENIEFSL